ncbi:MAG: metalloregulator ArsR/SmtB family transcription factor [Verrucomicrobiota bacterium]
MPKSAKAPLDEAALQLVARRFAMLGEPMRLRILQALMAGELPVNTLVEATAGTQTNISRHLQTLAAAGLVERRKEGLQVFYSVADPSIFELCNLVCGGLRQSLKAQADRLG